MLYGLELKNSIPTRLRGCARAENHKVLLDHPLRILYIPISLIRIRLISRSRSTPVQVISTTVESLPLPQRRGF